jgi:hypothetical protein
MTVFVSFFVESASEHCCNRWKKQPRKVTPALRVTESSKATRKDQS